MTIQEARRILSSLAPERVDRIFAKAVDAAGEPESTVYVEENTGRYNAVPLPNIPAEILSITDEGKGELTWFLFGSQAVCDRFLVPPVTVEYVTLEAAVEHDKQIAVELERLRPTE